MFAVPSAARLACWLNAWLCGRESADDVIDGLVAGDAQVDFDGLAPDPLSPALLLGELRRIRVRRVSVTLPSAGDLVGLGGPPDFNTDALTAGEAVILHGPGLGLVPRRVGRAVHWAAAQARPPTYLPDVATADRDLRQALAQAATDLATLDVASWSPDVADALLNLRQPKQLDMPVAFASPAAAHTALSGLRCLDIVSLALRDDGGSLSSSEATRRREALIPLERAARAAVVAACSSCDGR